MEPSSILVSGRWPCMYGGRNAGTIVYSEVPAAMAASQNPPSPMVGAWKPQSALSKTSPTKMLLFLSAEKKTPTKQDQTSTVAQLGCQVSADTTPISGPRGGCAHAMPCSGPQGGVPEPRLVFQTTLLPSARGTSRAPVRLPSALPPIASHRSGTTSSNPRFHGVYCPATLLPKE